LKFGVQDPEQWLESVPERIWRVWQAYFYTEPEQFGMHIEQEEKQPSIEEQIHSTMAAFGVRGDNSGSIDRAVNGGVIWPPPR
jgi:hypothetical protein